MLDVLFGLLLSAPQPVVTGEAFWELLRGGGQVVLLQHAATDQMAGDPPGFQLEDCATQRNLSEAGRDEARRIGAAFRANGVPVTRVLSSRWCRCLETARLAFDRVEPWPSLDSLFDERAREPQQTRAVRALAGRRLKGGNLVLVTHPANITALSGERPVPGEIVVLTPRLGGRFTVTGRLPASPRPRG